MTSDGPGTPWAPSGKEGGLWLLAGKREGPAPTTASGAADFSVPANPALAMVPQTEGINPNRKYGLPELIDIAQRNNPATREAWQRARSAALAVGMVEATYLPIITASAIGGRQTVQTPLPVPVGTERYLQANVSGVNAVVALQWLIFDFGQRAAISDAAKEAAMAANVLFNFEHQKLIFEVTSAYYTYGASLADLAIARQTVGNSQSIAAAADARFASGTGTSIEVAQARQLAAQSRLRLVEAEGRERTSYQVLVAAMGIHSPVRLNVEDARNRRLPTPSNVPLDSMIRLALTQRPDVIAAYSAVAASQAGVRAATAEFMPKVYVAGTVGTGHGSFSINNLPGIGEQADGAGILVGATVPLYDGGLRSAQLAQAQSRAAAAESLFHRTQTAAITEIVAASNALRTALESYKAASELASAANLTYDATVDAYKNGVGTVTAATAASTGLLDARQAQADTHAAALISAATLAFAVGSLTSRDAVR
ncbi:TolC family protein [Aureimonas fodinaquatilis]|uniref:Protein CyaE n=2 Tax=Aureimonas fodinaquatilis TaxID=2565783 RepID=A0A5B0DSW7_9HYPH|nr:TolC family protein [Aureimonas fodinaquatilis]